MEGAFKPLQYKVFRLESVGHREPSQKLKFIQITVFGFFWWGARFVLATVTCRIPYQVLNPGPAVKLPSPKDAESSASLYTSPESNLRDRAWGDVEKKSFVTLPGKGSRAG